MRVIILLVALVATHHSIASSAVNRQFHVATTEGITIFNGGEVPVEIFSRSIIPGLPSKDLRNTGTRYTVMPKSDITYYLPAGTKVIATDGVYWDDPAPNDPDERIVLTVVEGDIAKVSATEFTFGD